MAHCGTSLEGDFIWSVTYTDIYSGWTANRAVFNKGATGIVAATQEVEDALPFKVLGFDCDNGSEFLNHHLVSYFTKRPKQVKFTRSRPYHKNDNGTTRGAEELDSCPTTAGLPEIGRSAVSGED